MTSYAQMTLGERIRARREFLNHTRETLGSLTGISVPQLVRYEYGKNKPTSDMIIALANGLGVTSHWLLGVSDEVTPEKAGLSDLELKALELLRSKPRENQLKMLELLEVASKF